MGSIRAVAGGRVRVESLPELPQDILEAESASERCSAAV